MAATSVIVFFVFFFFFSTSTILPSIARAEPQAEMIARVCQKGVEDDLTRFAKNFLQSMDSVHDQMVVQGFGFASAGEPPDQTYVLAQCMGNLSPSDCSVCFSEIRPLLSGCFPSVGGRVYMDGCFVRADNYSFYNETVTSLDTKECGLFSGNNGTKYRETVEHLVKDLETKAPTSKGYWKGDRQSPEGKVFGLANCWRTLDQKSCRSCLRNAAAKVLSCLPSKEGRALNAGCFVRYTDTDFISNVHDVWTDARLLSALMVTIVITAALSTGAIALGIFMGKMVYKRVHDEGRLNGIDMESSVIKRSLKFEYSTLEKATSFFSPTNRLGHGSSGEVYKGILADGREIAVKRLFVNAKSHWTQICNEINVVSRAQHKNLVRFLGCSFDGPDSLLVYEFVPNKSLDCTLFDPERKAELDWKKRLAIIIGIAEGLEYLHMDCEVKIVHRDIKASNILLDVRFRPKIADFGLAKYFSSRSNHVSSAVAGTLGYMAPEYITHGQLTEKVDVYSFGVVVLEIISGVQSNKFTTEGSSIDTLITATWKHFQSNTISEIIDESMEVDDTGIAEVSRVARVGLLCTQEAPNLRPSTTTVLQMLRQKDLKIPTPTKPPFIDESMELSHISDSPRLLLHPAVLNTRHYSDLGPQ